MKTSPFVRTGWRRCRTSPDSWIVIPFVAIIAAFVATQPVFAQPHWQTVGACSVRPFNSAATDHCFGPAISANGRHVLFVTRDRYMPGAYDGDVLQVYAFDRQVGRVSIVSATVNSGSPPLGGDLDSVAPAISADGRYVAIQTDARNIVPPFSSIGPRIVVIDRDRDTDGVFDEPQSGGRAAALVSVRSDGVRINNSLRPTISASGRFVAFHASAQPLLRGDAMGLPYLAVSADVFVHDRDADSNGIFDETAAGARKTVQVNVDSAGLPATAGTNSLNAVISGGGRFIAYESNASNLVSGDANGLSDIFVHDRDADGNGTFDEPGGIATARVNESTAGDQANGPTSRPAVSEDGRYVAFDSLATNLVNAPTNGVRQVYLRDRVTQSTRMVSARGGRAAARSDCYGPTISADGRYVAFQTASADLVPGDTNGSFDVIVWDRWAADAGVIAVATAEFQRVTVDNAGNQIEFGGIYPAISGDGRSLAFASVSTNVIPINRQGIFRQVYVAERKE